MKKITEIPRSVSAACSNHPKRESAEYVLFTVSIDVFPDYPCPVILCHSCLMQLMDRIDQYLLRRTGEGFATR